VPHDRAKAIRSALLTAYNVGKAGGGARIYYDKNDTYKAMGGEVLPLAHPEREANLSKFMEKAHPEVLNENGTPKILYHGSIKPNLKRFDLSKAVEVEGGLFLTDNPDVAHQYTYERAYGDIIGDEPLGKVHDVYVNMRNPYIHPTKPGQKIVDAIEMGRAVGYAKKNGHDGVIVKNIDDSVGQTGEMGDTYVAFHPNQIKSAIGNRGTFDPNEPDITKAGGGDVDFFHGSPETAPTFKIDESPRRVYSGIFGTKNNQIAKSHGENLYTVKVPENKILSNYELNYEIPYEKVSSIIKKLHPHGDQDIAHHLIVEDGDVFKTDPQELERIFRTSDAGEAGWAAQDSKGKLAKALGYDAVQTPDEHGEGTHLIVNGTAFRHTPDITKAGGGDVEPDEASPVYYSALKQGVADAKQMQAPPQDWKAITSKLPGVRKEEIDYSGLHNFLDKQQGQVSKADLLDHLEQNPAVKLNEVWKSGTTGPNKTKFGQWTLPDGNNYQELAMTLPKKAEDEKNYKSSAAHSYGDDDSDINRLAHIRMNDRVGPNGEKLLHIEELQSDWHQEGRESGYKSDSPRKQYYVKNKISGNQSQAFDSMNEATVYRDRLPNNVRANVRFYEQLLPDNNRMVPDAPYKDTKDWTALALKRVMRHAANNNYDGVTWTTGDQQADRYDISKKVKLLSVNKQKDGKYLTYIEDHDGDPMFSGTNGFSDYGQKSMTEKELEETVGKDIAKKAIEGTPNKEGWFDIKDEGLRVGGEGMRKYYDEIVPSVANNIAKEHGVKHSMIQYPESGKKYRIEQVGTQMGRPSYTAYDEDDNMIDRSTIRQDVEDVVKQKKGMAGERLHYLPVTPSMKKSARLFKSGGTVEPYKHTGVIHPARMISGVHIRHETHGTPIFTGGKHGR